jgi:Ca-activated chloride channel homolog
VNKIKTSIMTEVHKSWRRIILSAFTVLFLGACSHTPQIPAVTATPVPSPEHVHDREQLKTQMAATLDLAQKMEQRGAEYKQMDRTVMSAPRLMSLGVTQDFNTENYTRYEESRFLETLKNPLSTFSLDVDTASYANVRRFLNNGTLPPPDAVRIEELLNYFHYNYPQPTGDAPFAVTTELTESPWHKGNQLLLVGVQGKRIATDQLPPANLVFLVDVSGSMAAENRLPLLVKSFKMLTNELRPQDKITIVTYAGTAGVALSTTSGGEKQTIIAALDRLRAGGSTNGSGGIVMAYNLAKENFISGGNNRVILATDGDFNVGMTSDGDLERLIEDKRKENIFLSVLGVGMGNYKDSKMQKLADKGNGNYNYLDNLLEAKKVLVHQFGGTLMTIAKDVKLQVEFNPARVKSYRLVGYEKRKLQAEDYTDDKKDAGELGAGHTVTALYEIVPADGKVLANDLVFQTTAVKKGAYTSPDLAVVRCRFKKPEADESKEITTSIPAAAISWSKAGNDIRFASAVAGWGMILRNSEFKGDASFPQVLATARASRGADDAGFRAEFIRLVELAEVLGMR